MGVIVRNGSGDLTTASLSSKTEGWLELFVNAAEKRTCSLWQEVINNKSLTHRATKNTFNWIASVIPDNVAPNLITAAGL